MRKMDNNLMDINQLIKAEKTEDIVSDLKNIIELSQKQAYQAINTALVYRNWLIGYRIAVFRSLSILLFLMFCLGE